MNANFTSLKDLDGIDERISEIEGHKVKINDVVRNKVSSDSEADAAASTEYEELKIRVVAEVLLGLDGLLEMSDEGTMTHIDELMEQYGSLSVLKDARQLCEKKIALKKELTYLERAAELETEVCGLEDAGIEKVAEVHEKIEALGDTAAETDNSDVILRLSTALDGKITTLRSKLESEFSRLLDDMKWLGPKFEQQSIPQAQLTSIYKYLSHLFRLQRIKNTPDYPNTWWAIDVLLQPIIMRFNFHFNTPSKETNKLSKPEWALNFIENFLTENMPYLKLVIGEAIEPFAGIIEYEVINSLLNPVREKMFKMIEAINENISKFSDQHDNREKSGRILSHLIFELSSFDQRLRNVYKFNPYVKDITIVPSKKWMGLTGDILLHGDNDNLAATNWLNFELELATERFNSEIIKSEKAFNIDFDYQVSHGSDTVHEKLLKPTYSAYNLSKLFNNLTNHHKTLNIVKYQLKYVSNIQLKLVDSYFDKLSHLLRNFNDSFNLKNVLNFIPGGLGSDGANTETNSTKNALKGLEILTEIYCLAKFMGDNLEQWSEELIFIQLWNSYKSISNTRHATGLTIFDNTISESQQLISKILNNYNQFFRKEIKASLKNYVNSSQWDIAASTNIETSSDLSLLVNNLPIYMSYLEKCLSDLDYYIISNSVVSLLFTVLREFIITNNLFTATGIKQLKVDFDFIVSQLKYYLLLSLSVNEYSNSANKDYLKSAESIDLLLGIDSQTAKLFKNQYGKISELRSKFEGGLNHLSDHEINDLIFRIL